MLEINDRDCLGCHYMWLFFACLISKYYEREALIHDSVFGPILAALLGKSMWCFSLNIAIVEIYRSMKNERHTKRIIVLVFTLRSFFALFKYIQSIHFVWNEHFVIGSGSLCTGVLQAQDVRSFLDGPVSKWACAKTPHPRGPQRTRGLARSQACPRGENIMQLECLCNIFVVVLLNVMCVY